jgi:hypothetical protein
MSDDTRITWAGEVDDADTVAAGTIDDEATAMTWAGEVDDAGTTARQAPDADE